MALYNIMSFEKVDKIHKTAMHAGVSRMFADPTNGFS